MHRFGLALGAILLTQSGLFNAYAGEVEEATAAPASMEVAADSVDINSASADELASRLVGIGLSRADAIVRYREQFGPFESIDELSEVKGVGAATVDRNRARIRLQ